VIAHVAEASEFSGRVVLWLDPETRCAPSRLDSAIRLAAAYGAEIETLVVAGADDEDAEVVPIGRVGRAGSCEPARTPHNRRELLTQRCRLAVEAAAAAHRVTVRHTLAQGDAVDRLSEMCLAPGPWNIVALARMPALGADSLINTLLANVSGATGFLLCGEPHGAGRSRVVVIVEDADRLPSMLRVAGRLSKGGGTAHIVIGVDTAVEHAELEGQARLLTSGAAAVVFEKSRPTLGVPGALTELIARLRPSLVVARFGGSGVADGRELGRASAVTRAPILLVR
jgi:hypothetical protein